MLVVTVDQTGGGAVTGGSNKGFVINSANGKIWGTSAKYGYIYNETNSSDANNDN